VRPKASCRATARVGLGQHGPKSTAAGVGRRGHPANTPTTMIHTPRGPTAHESTTAGEVRMTAQVAAVAVARGRRGWSIRYFCMSFTSGQPSGWESLFFLCAVVQPRLGHVFYLIIRRRERRLYRVVRIVLAVADPRIEPGLNTVHRESRR